MKLPSANDLFPRKNVKINDFPVINEKNETCHRPHVQGSHPKSHLGIG